MKIQDLLNEDSDMLQENLSRRVKDMLNHPTNPLTPEELLQLAERQPHIYGQFRKMAKKLIHAKNMKRDTRKHQPSVDHEYASSL